MAERDEQLVDAIASKAMGLEPSKPAVPPETAAPSAEAQDKDAPTTPQEVAMAEASPATEADAMSADPITYKVGDRNYTEKQLLDMKGRYAKANFQNARYKPTMDVIRQLEAKYETTPDELAKAIMQLAESPAVAQAASATVGAEQGNVNVPNADQEGVYKAWVEENSVSGLPPGYEDIAPAIRALAQTNSDTQRMLREVLAHSDGAVKAAAEFNAESQRREQMNLQRAVANNLDRAQQMFSMTEEDAMDFKNFAEDRGYMIEEDFIDPELLVNVVRDFRNRSNEGELAQLRSQRERRQAVSGSIGSSPGTESPAQRGAQPEGQTDLDRLAQNIIAQRNQPV